MRKILLGTTAIVAAGMVASAPALSAEKLQVGIGGYMEQWVGMVDNDDYAGTDASGLNNYVDSEVHFKGKTALDNGLTVGVQIELEGNSQGHAHRDRDASNTAKPDDIDESYMWIEGEFGKIILGSENSAMYLMHYGVRDFGIGLNSGDLPNWLSWEPGITGGGYWRNPLGSTNVEPNGTNDSEKISYFTPRMGGFQLGLSYGPDTKEDNSDIVDRNGGLSDMVAVGLNFQQAFDGAEIRVSGGYGTINNNKKGGDDPTAYNVGARVNYGGFGIEAAYANFDDSEVKNGDGVSFGINYSSGPWGISLAWFNGEMDGDVKKNKDTGKVESIKGHRSHETVHLSGKYALGPGISFNGTIGTTTVETDDSEYADAKNKEADATYFVIGVKASF